MCTGPKGGNCYRVLLGKSEYFQSRKEYLRTLVCFLDSLLYVVYTSGVLLLIVAAYLLCVGIGYPFVSIGEKEDKSAAIIWVSGFGVGGLILIFLGAVIFFSYIAYIECHKYVTSEDFLVTEGEKYERVNQTESELSSLEQIQ